LPAFQGYLALLARFDFSPSKIDPQYLTHWRELLPVFIAIVLTEYVCGQMYAIMWSQAGMSYLDIIPELR
jgi:hypothetical protein